jgi:hypothetical protein
MFDMEKNRLYDIHCPNASRCYKIKYVIYKVLISWLK